MNELLMQPVSSGVEKEDRYGIARKIVGLDARQMRGMFKNFIAQESEMDWNDGKPVVKVRRMTPDFIERQLGISSREAQRIQAELIDEGWIEQGKFTPTRKGMALAHHVDRPTLPRAEAEAILDQVLEWADRTNAVADTRVKVKAIHLYGSLERGADEVADIDLFIEFTTMDLGEDMQPEDMEQESELCEELSAISEYVSPSSALDRMVMDDVSMRQVFPPRD
ncbi:hypothetical protein [Acidiphilium iwatense]|uniref:Polymerase nucleotidyl transferase domain-containing protein n=1 Tax=Acidiphilium iwatense TaxID=768198 RepID=A0ABS9DWV9_9PROT|nr:hypothetical protein [Acidiphilium iwatense]MCF3947221.1 hypothetical protein [Acidiphilium iwatense]